jgi:hypothetical protein
VIVRKDTDENDHHIGGSLIGVDEARGKYAIVDDFTASGATLRFIQKRIAERAYFMTPETAPAFVGYFSYADDFWYPADMPEAMPCELTTPIGTVGTISFTLSNPISAP